LSLPPPPADLPALPDRPRDGHKGTFGKVVVLAGSPRYSGAAVLCARAALRAGAGLAVIGCPRTIHPSIAARVLCETTAPLPDVAPGVFGRISIADALALAESGDAVALGPGLANDPGTLEFARALTGALAIPTVVDADALNAFVGHTAELARVPGPRVYTPHPGEAARLLGLTTAAVQQDRNAASELLSALGAGTWVLKGAGTLVRDGERVVRNPTGNPGMATGGTGDVLTGVVAALLAQGLAPFDAARLGAWLHGRAGDHAAARLGERSVLATDLLAALPTAFREL
jgi:NAD(P)H-hydrate epimerase